MPCVRSATYASATERRAIPAQARGLLYRAYVSAAAVPDSQHSHRLEGTLLIPLIQVTGRPRPGELRRPGDAVP